MTYSIIGAGNVGGALAHHFTRVAIPVCVANSRGPQSLEGLRSQYVTPVSIEEALGADIIILATPFMARAAVAAASDKWKGKVIIDAMNTYGVPEQELRGLPSSVVVSESFPGAHVVKTFNQLPAKLLAQNPGQESGRRVMFVAGDDAAAVDQARALAERLGFAPIVLGTLSEGGALIGMGGPLILKNLLAMQ